MIKKIINKLLCIHNYEILSEHPKIAFEKGHIQTSNHYMICTKCGKIKLYNQTLI